MSPGKLTPDQRAVALADLDLSYDLIMRQKILSDVGGFDIPWKEYAATQLKVILGTPIGQFDYQTYRATRWDPELLLVGDRILENNEQIECGDFRAGFEEWLGDDDV